MHIKFYLVHFHVLDWWVCGSWVSLPCPRQLWWMSSQGPLHSQNGSYWMISYAVISSHRPSGVSQTPLRTSVPLFRIMLYQQCHSHAFSPSKPHFPHQRPSLRQPFPPMHLFRSRLSFGHLYILLLNFSPILISLLKLWIALYA